MENLILPGFFKVRNPQAGVNEDESEFINFFVEKYDNIGDNYSIILKCLKKDYELFKFMKINGQKNMMSLASGMSLYIRAELARLICSFTKKNVTITDIYGLPADGDIHEIGISVIINNPTDARICAMDRIDSDNMFIMNERPDHQVVEDYRHSSSLLNNTFFDTAYFNSKEIFESCTINDRKSGMKLYHWLRIKYDNLEKIEYEEMCQHIPPTLKKTTRNIDECRNQLISEILNQFIISCNIRDVAVGLITISKKLHAKLYAYVSATATGVKMSGTDVDIVIIPKYDYVIDGESIDLDYTLSLDEKNSKYCLELSTNHVFYECTVNYAMKIVKQYYSLLKDMNDPDEMFKVIIGTEKAFAEDKDNPIMSTIKMLNMLESDETENGSDFSPLMLTDKENPLTDCAMQLSALLAHSLVEDISNVILQSYALGLGGSESIADGIIFLNAMNISTVTKSDDIPKIFTFEDVDADVEMLMTDDDYSLYSEDFDGRMHFRKTGEYIAFTKRGASYTTNKKFNAIMGAHIKTKSCSLLKGEVSIFENGNFIIAELSSVPEDAAACTIMNEYDMIMMDYLRHTNNVPTSFITRPTVANFNADAYFQLRNSAIPRLGMPARYAILGAYNMPKEPPKKKRGRPKKST